MTCECDVKRVELPVVGLTLSVDESALAGAGGEVITPDLRVGVETKWPARYMGKQVYAQLVDCGKLPASATTKTVPHNIPDMDWFQLNWEYSHTEGSASSFPHHFALFYMQPTGTDRFRFSVSNTDVRITANANFSDWQAIVCLLYTKTTDQPVNP